VREGTFRAAHALILLSSPGPCHFPHLYCLGVTTDNDFNTYDAYGPQLNLEDLPPRAETAASESTTLDSPRDAPGQARPPQRVNAAVAAASGDGYGGDDPRARAPARRKADKAIAGKGGAKAGAKGAKDKNTADESFYFYGRPRAVESFKDEPSAHVEAASAGKAGFKSGEGIGNVRFQQSIDRAPSADK